jgi:hypothetical protein
VVVAVAGREQRRSEAFLGSCGEVAERLVPVLRPKLEVRSSSRLLVGTRSK